MKTAVKSMIASQMPAAPNETTAIAYQVTEQAHNPDHISKGSGQFEEPSAQTKRATYHGDTGEKRANERVPPL
jgi:hypothetical protein